MIKYLTNNEETVKTLIITIHTKIYPGIQYKCKKWCDCVKQINMYLDVCLMFILNNLS